MHTRLDTETPKSCIPNYSSGKYKVALSFSPPKSRIRKQYLKHVTDIACLSLV